MQGSILDKQGYGPQEMAKEWDAELPPFPSEILDRMSKIIGKEITPNSSLDLTLRIVKNSYQTQRGDPGKTYRQAQRERIRKASKELRKALAAVEELKLDDIMPIIRASSSPKYSEIVCFNKTLEKLVPLFKAEAARKLPRAREKNKLVQNTCGWLKRIFDEHASGPATLSTWKNSIDMGEPQSDFGRFATAFFEFTDPELPAKKLVQPLKDAVWESRRGTNTDQK